MDDPRTLTPLSEAPEGPLEWAQVSAWGTAHELRRDDRRFATLHWRSSMGSLATLTTRAGVWTFKRTGFWTPRITVRVAGSLEDLAVFTPGGWSGGRGVLQFAGGPTVNLVREGFWTSSWRFLAGDVPLMEVGDVGGVFRSRAALTLAPGVKADPRAPLLAGLLWYVVMLAYQDAAAAGASAAVVAAAGA